MKAEIIKRLFEEKHITVDEAMTLMMNDNTVIKYITYPTQNPVYPYYPVSPVWINGIPFNSFPANSFPTVSLTNTASA